MGLIFGLVSVSRCDLDLHVTASSVNTRIHRQTGGSASAVQGCTKSSTAVLDAADDVQLSICGTAHGWAGGMQHMSGRCLISILSLFLKSDFLKKFQVASGNAAGTGLRPGPAARPQIKNMALLDPGKGL